MSALGRCCFVAFLFVLHCFGGLPETRTPTQAFFSKDGTKILIVLSERSPAEDKGRYVTLPSGKLLDVRSNFTNSGCYWIESLMPVYLLDWRANFYEKVYASDDLDHVVKANLHGMDRNAAWGLKLFSKGNEMVSYGCQQLVNSKARTSTPFASVGYPHQNWGYYFEWFDDEKTRFASPTFILQSNPRYLFVLGHVFKIARGEEIILDQISGRIIRRTQAGHVLQYICGVALMFVIILFLFLVWKRLNKPSRKAQANNDGA